MWINPFREPDPDLVRMQLPERTGTTPRLHNPEGARPDRRRALPQPVVQSGDTPEMQRTSLAAVPATFIFLGKVDTPASIARTRRKLAFEVTVGRTA